jgi:hypothetical protein
MSSNILTLKFANQELNIDLSDCRKLGRLNTLSYSIYLDYRRKNYSNMSTRTVILVVASVFIYLMNSTLKRILT